MKKTSLIDGSKIYCISPTEGQMLYEHINGYLDHDFIKLKSGDTVIDIGANIEIFGIKLSKMFSDIKIFAFEPVDPIFSVLKKKRKRKKRVVRRRGQENEARSVIMTEVVMCRPLARGAAQTLPTCKIHSHF